MTRESFFAGSFYPNNKDELLRLFASFESCKQAYNPKAVIVPHAGYIYSGSTANLAYSALSGTSLERFVIIAPSHKYAYDGVSLCEFSSYATPFGEIKADLDLAHYLRKRHNLECYPQAHAEHSSETQLPFLKHYKPNSKVLELIYSNSSVELLACIIEDLLLLGDVGIIISTDLSHFYTLDEAKKLDQNCLDAIANLDEQSLRSKCEACGTLGVEAMLRVAKKLDLKPHILNYTTSAEASGDESRVVGYTTAVFE